MRLEDLIKGGSLNNLRKIIVILLKVGGLCIVGLYMSRILINTLSPRPAILGVLDGQLVDCPSSPNCVSSQADDTEHKVNPIPYATSMSEAKGKLMGILAATPQVSVVVEQPNYIHVEFSTPLLHFIDDVEFYFNEDEKQIELRSASRVGYDDLGVNRTRIEEIRRHFNGKS